MEVGPPTRAVERGATRPRNPIACESCRTSKTRCFRSEQANICQRCLKSHLPCIIRTEPHPKRAQRARAAEVQHDLQKAPAQAVSDFHIKLSATPVPDVSESMVDLHTHHMQRFEVLAPKDDDLPVLPTRFGETSRISQGATASRSHVVDARTLDLERAQELLYHFRVRSQYFPFVVIDEDATVQSLSKSSPFLLLAILTVASNTDVLVHHQVDHEFRRVLSMKVVVDGEKSLEYLQGLLVYIAWYPSHLKMQHTQWYMYMNLAVSLLHDLGIDEMTHDDQVSSLRGIDMTGLYEGEGLSRAAKRAFLGCYYLSSATAITSRKPNIIPWCETMEEYGRSLCLGSVVLSDLVLRPLVNANRLRESLNESLKGPAGLLQQNHLAFDANAHVLQFEREAEIWRSEVPEIIRLSPIIVEQERFLQVLVYCYDTSQVGTSKKQKEWLSASPSYMRSEYLSQCVDGFKRYMEYILSLNPPPYQNFTAVQAGCFIQSIVTMFKLSFDIPHCPEWDSAAAREHAPLSMYLGCICYQLQGITSTPLSQGAPRNPDFAFIFKAILESLKISYDRKVAAATLVSTTSDTSTEPLYTGNTGPTPTSERTPSSCPMFDPDLAVHFDSWQAASTEPQLQDDFRVNPADQDQKQEGPPVFFDIWATMTQGWAEN